MPSPPACQPGIAPRQRQHNHAIEHLLDRLADIAEGEHWVEHGEDPHAADAAGVAA